MKRYLEIVGPADVVVKRFDVTGRPERQQEKLDDGVNRNLDHERYFTRFVSSSKDLPVGDVAP